MRNVLIYGLTTGLSVLTALWKPAVGQHIALDQPGDNINKWILHNPSDSRNTLFIAPFNRTTNSWDWSKNFMFKANGDLGVRGTINTEDGRFSSFYSANTDGFYPGNVINALGQAQLSIGANWTGGRTDLSLINSNIGNTSGGGFSFWQMTSATSKKQLAYFAGNGRVGIGVQDPAEYAKLQVYGEGGIMSSGPGAHFRIQDQKSTRTTEPWLDEWLWFATDNIARFHRPGLGDIMTFNGTGNVGIGVTDPTARLQVAGAIQTTNGQFSSIYSGNSDNKYPANVANAIGEAQLSIGANWTSGYTDLSLINSNIGNTTGGGFSFWQMTGATGKRMLAYFQGNGNVGIGPGIPEARLHVSEGGFRHGGVGEISIDAPGVVGGRFKILNNGNVGIGTNSPGAYKLAVEGKIGAREVEVKTGAWADFVFKADYELPTLKSVEEFVQQYQHLPGIPSEAEVQKEGVNLGQMNVKLLQKIEELTLYMIKQQKQIEQLQERLDRKQDK